MDNLTVLDRTKETTATTGTGTVTLSGTRVAPFQTWANGGAQDGKQYPYLIEDGNDSEWGIGTYTASGTTFSRDIVTASIIAGVSGTTKINLSGTATVACVTRARDSSGLVPALSTFTWANQGTSTALQSTANGAISLNLQNNSGTLNWRIISVNQPSTPYKVRAQIFSQWGGGNSQAAGIYFYDGTKIDGLEVLSQGAGYIICVRRSNPLSGSASSVTNYGAQWVGNTAGTAPIWFQQRNDASNLYFDVSFDGQNFTNVLTEAVGAYLTPTKLAFGGLNFASSGGTLLIPSLLNWQIYPNANLNGL